MDSVTGIPLRPQKEPSHSSPTCRLTLPASVVGAPVAVVAGHQTAGDEQDQVHEPPDSQASQGEQLPHGRACVAQAEAVDAEAAQEEGVQQRGDEVVSCVSVEEAKDDLTAVK